MGLVISAADAGRLRNAIQLLLMPLSYRHVTQWCADVEQVVRELLRADHSLFVLPQREALLACSQTLAACDLARLHSQFSGFVPGRARCADPALDRLYAQGSAAGLEVHGDMLDRRDLGGAMPRDCFIADTMRTSGAREHVGLRVALPLGEAELGFGYATSGSHRHKPRTRQALLELLLPAFRAGVSEFARVQWWPCELGRKLQELGAAALVTNEAGHEMYRTRPLIEMLRGTDGGELIAAVQQLTRELGVRAPSPVAGNPLGIRETAAPTCVVAGAYRLRGALVRLGPGRDATGVILAESLHPEFATADELARFARLTPREAEVALLLARGLSALDTAAKLGVSPHTVRTHAMRIFRKLNLHSRLALTARLAEIHAAQ
jgi:DNA-binding CsgD family transcriptional regulator